MLKKKQTKFKPFEQVLVRDADNQPWRCGIYSHYDATNKIHQCTDTAWVQCIPYNEETMHLVNTCTYPTPVEPKEYHVWTNGMFNEWFTKDEFENFIKTAVINNKDITDFHVLYVKNHN